MRLMSGARADDRPTVTYDTTVLMDGPLGYWPMDDGSGMPKDASSNGKHLLLLAGSDQIWVEDGGRTVIDTSNTSLLCPVRCPQSAYTYECWMKPLAAPQSDTCIIGDWGGNAGAVGAMLYQVSTTFRFYHRGSYVGFSNVPYGEWRHMAVTWDGSTVRCYQNGSMTHSIPTTEAPGNGDISSFSTYGNSNSRYFKGRISRAAWYSYALPAERIQERVTLGVEA